MNSIYRRDLDPSDMERMCIPKRHWMSRFDMLSETNGEESVKSFVKKYLDKLKEMRKAGAGFILYGLNGVGKTGASVVVAKEYRRYGYTVLFMEAADLKRMVVQREYFDESETYWDRARSVDVLVLDDFGKGIQDSTGFGASLFDELIRARSAGKLVTIITANIDPGSWQKELELKFSTISALKECTIPVQVEGEVLRKSIDKILDDK